MPCGARSLKICCAHFQVYDILGFIMNPNYYIACDLGAESGRVMLGRLEDGRLELEELHRFPSAVVRVLGSLRWDVLRIFEELKTGLRAVAQRNLPISRMSVDSWGVDYVLINAVHPVLWPPFHYRDARTTRPTTESCNTLAPNSFSPKRAFSSCPSIRFTTWPLTWRRAGHCSNWRLFPDHWGLFQLSFFRRRLGRRESMPVRRSFTTRAPIVVERIDRTMWFSKQYFSETSRTGHSSGSLVA